MRRSLPAGFVVAFLLGACGGTTTATDDGGAPDASPSGDGGFTSNVGPTGGTESSLYFAIVGDTRPPVVDDTKAYPTSVIGKIFSDVEGLTPTPPFIVTTGDYMFASTTGSQAEGQLQMYLGARQSYSGIDFPAMGNHECTGATDSNCGSGNKDGVTANYTAFLNDLLGPISQTQPYYSINISATDSSWTAKFVFIAANAWSTAQASWLSSTLAQVTTYTFIIRHESATAYTAPGVDPSEKIMQQYPYTLAIVGHSHTHDHPSTREVLFGNGGAPLTSGTYGFGLVTQRGDGAIQVDAYDYSTGASDPSFRFALKPDGTPAP